jgi:hypothetical protein
VSTPSSPYTEVFAVDFVFGWQWGFQCFTCGFEQIGVTDFLTAEEHAEDHRCPVHADA